MKNRQTGISKESPYGSPYHGVGSSRQALTTTFEATDDAHIATSTAGMVDFALKTYGSTDNITIRITHNPKF